MIGFGAEKALINVYTANTPPVDWCRNLYSMKPMNQGDVALIATLTGNHWRKVFNVYAKFLFELEPCGYSSWQRLRDEHLLQSSAEHNLIFSSPKLEQLQHISIVMGKTYAASVVGDIDLHWLDNDFAVSTEYKLIVCPYFDYRQLSNIKITRLLELVRSLQTV